MFLHFPHGRVQAAGRPASHKTSACQHPTAVYCCLDRTLLPLAVATRTHVQWGLPAAGVFPMGSFLSMALTGSEGVAAHGTAAWLWTRDCNPVAFLSWWILAFFNNCAGCCRSDGHPGAHGGCSRHRPAAPARSPALPQFSQSVLTPLDEHCLQQLACEWWPARQWYVCGGQARGAPWVQACATSWSRWAATRRADRTWWACCSGGRWASSLRGSPACSGAPTG